MSRSIVWLADPADPPLPTAATEVAIDALAARLGVVIGDTATIIVADTPGLGGYPLLRAYGAGSGELWSTSHEILVRELDALGDARLADAGLGVGELTLERSVARLFRRRLPHFTDEQLRDLDALAPRLAELIGRLER